MRNQEIKIAHGCVHLQDLYPTYGKIDSISMGINQAFRDFSFIKIIINFLNL